MHYAATKTRLVFLPLLLLSIVFILAYCLLYWLFYIELHVIPLKEEVVQLWIPGGIAIILVLLFIRPRVHLLMLDKNDGKIRTLYYMVAGAVLCVPIVIATGYLESAMGKLTRLGTINEIVQKPATRYYTLSTYNLSRQNIGVSSRSSYSGKHNESLNFHIYIAVPIGIDSTDTVSSPAAFLAVHYQEQISSKISDAEREKKWRMFWDESFWKFDYEPPQFMYLEKIGNTDERENLLEAAGNSRLHSARALIIMLKPVNAPFDQRNGNKLFYIFLSFAIGILVWLIMVLLPGLHIDKAEMMITDGSISVKQQLAQTYQAIKPIKGFIGTPVLIVLNILVFIIMVFKGMGFVTFNNRALISMGAIYEPAIKEGEWWRLITGMFLHGGVMHLLMNMISLYLAGLFTEVFIKTKQFLIGYLVSGIVAGLISLWWHDKPVVAVGASGAIFGLYGILLSLMAFKTFGASFNKSMLILLGCTAGYSLLMGFLSRGIDNSAHLGGLLAGCILGAFFADKIKNEGINQETSSDQ